MPVPYTFANIPNGQIIPLGQLDANFAYIENQIGTGAAGLTGQIQFNVNGYFTGNQYLTFDATTSTFSTPNINSSALTISNGSIPYGSLTTGTLFSTQSLLINGLSAHNVGITDATLMVQSSNASQTAYLVNTSVDSTDSRGFLGLYLNSPTMSNAVMTFSYETTPDLATINTHDHKWTINGGNEGTLVSANYGLTYDGTLSLGVAGSRAGTLSLAGAASGKITVRTQPAAGTWTMILPATSGMAGQYLQTDGNGLLTWASGTTTPPGGLTTQVQYNNAGSFGGNAAFTFDVPTTTLSITNIKTKQIETLTPTNVVAATWYYNNVTAATTLDLTGSMNGLSITNAALSVMSDTAGQTAYFVNADVSASTYKNILSGYLTNATPLNARFEFSADTATNYTTLDFFTNRWQITSSYGNILAAPTGDAYPGIKVDLANNTDSLSVNTGNVVVTDGTMTVISPDAGQTSYYINTDTVNMTYRGLLAGFRTNSGPANACFAIYWNPTENQTYFESSTNNLSVGSYNVGYFKTNLVTNKLIMQTINGNYASLLNAPAGAGGDITGVWNNVSDETLKENVEEYTGSLDKVKQLKGVSYTWINDDSGRTEIGLIAQDVQKVIPEVVKDTFVDNKLGIAYTSLIPVLINAIKELEARVAELEAKK